MHADGRPPDDEAREAPPVPPARSPKRRAEVIREAARLFDERGYHQALMEDIARAAGIRKTTLYHYFRSKDEILFSIHDEFIELLIARQERRAGLEIAPRQALLEIMGDVLELMETHRGFVRVFFEHHRELPPERHAAIARKRERYERMVRAVIEAGVAEGSFRAVDVHLATLALFGMCNWAYQWYEADGALRGREVAFVFWETLLYGIAGPRDPGRIADVRPD